jgi:hypothetical protein
VIDTQLRLPDLDTKPRQRGLTMVIDPGMFTGQFEDAVDSIGEFVDLVKFGWGTCLVTKDIKRKIDILHSAGIDFYFGGTLFERYALEGLVSEWLALCRGLGATHVEVSNGAIPLDNTAKARWVARLAGEFARSASRMPRVPTPWHQGTGSLSSRKTSPPAPTSSPPRRGRAPKAGSAAPTANHAMSWLARSSAPVSISIDCSSRLRTKPCRPISSAGLVLRPTWAMCGPTT